MDRTHVHDPFGHKHQLVLHLPLFYDVFVELILSGLEVHGDLVFKSLIIPAFGGAEEVVEFVKDVSA